MTITIKEMNKYIDKQFGKDVDQKFREYISRKINTNMCKEEDCSRMRANGSSRCQGCTDYNRKWSEHHD